MQNYIRVSSALTLEEAIEFEMLDALPPTDDSGTIGWIFEGEPTCQREKRWLELYTKLGASQPVTAPRTSSRALEMA
jgi:hypothetical protein